MGLINVSALGRLVRSEIRANPARLLPEKGTGNGNETIRDELR